MAKRELIEKLIWTTTLILGLIALRVWLFEPVTITSQMANNYVKEKDLVLAARTEEIHYGDLVLYKVDGKKYVGRIIALEDDKVVYMDDVLYRNDETVKEVYLTAQDGSDYYTEDFSILSLTAGKSERVTKGAYLILNDNRSNREDSRQFGLISADQIVGRLNFRLTPLDQFGFIDTGLAQ